MGGRHAKLLSLTGPMKSVECINTAAPSLLNRISSRLYTRHDDTASVSTTCTQPRSTMVAMDLAGWKGAVLRFWQRSYAADYVGYVLLQVAYFGVRSTSPARLTAR